MLEERRLGRHMADRSREAVADAAGVVRGTSGGRLIAGSPLDESIPLREA
jgi:hypothetical protein